MLRRWEFILEIRRESPVAPYLQIVHAIIDGIRRGRLSPGDALPGSRELAKTLLVNRKTVVLAFDELIAQGWLASEGTRGTFISPTLPTVQPASFAYRPAEPGLMPAQPDYFLPGSTSSIPIQLPNTGALTFDDGAPDTRLVPVEALARAYRRALVGSGHRNRLGYGDPRGACQLRSAVSLMLNQERGLATLADNICLTRGSQMAIFLAARILSGRGDVVVTETLCYPPAREAFRAAGAQVICVGQDSDGLRLDELEKACRIHKVRCVYVTPHHQFPTTVSLKPDRRLRLLALADQFGFAIVEDDYDHEFHFSGRPLLPLASADQWGKVVYIGSMSKLLAPSMRAGYIAAPLNFIQRAAEEILIIDRQGDSTTELAVADLLESGEIKRHARKVLKIYKQRRDFFAELLRSKLGGAVDFELPDGGLAFWVRFSAEIDVKALASDAAAHKLRFLPGSCFATQREDIQAARLGFASLNEDELADAVGRLQRAVHLQQAR